MTASVLSPLAHPFHPIMGEDPNPAIYNNGIPTLTIQGLSESEFLHTIQDEALDEAFPPNAEEAAELEAVEVFVDLMARLAFLEEKEEATRTVHAGLKKRWEARRELVKTRPPKHLVQQVIHGDPRLLQSNDIVMFDKSHALLEQRMQARERTHHIAKSRTQKGFASRIQNKRPIQQPRKQN